MGDGLRRRAGIAADDRPPFHFEILVVAGSSFSAGIVQRRCGEHERRKCPHGRPGFVSFGLTSRSSEAGCSREFVSRTLGDMAAAAEQTDIVLFRST
jgi:hypothetical protein